MVVRWNRDLNHIHDKASLLVKAADLFGHLFCEKDGSEREPFKQLVASLFEDIASRVLGALPRGPYFIGSPKRGAPVTSVTDRKAAVTSPTFPRERSH